MQKKKYDNGFSRMNMFVLSIIWILFIIASLAYIYYEKKQFIKESARIQARSLFIKDVIYRRWNAIEGGVYVHINEQTPPNKYLEDMAERDIETTTGEKLTLMNPAYMTRIVHEIGEKEYGFKAHITSLKPIRPENKATPWETRALEEFEKGIQEVSEVTEMDGGKYMTLMKPLITEKACMKCHEKQGYHVGDIRGGIRVSVPLEPLETATLSGFYKIVIILLLMMGAGLAGIRFAGNKIRQAFNQILDYQKTLADSHKKLEEAQKIAGLGHWEWNKETGRFSYSEQFIKIFKLKKSDLQSDLNEILESRVDAKEVAKVLFNNRQLIEKAVPYDFEYKIRHPNGKTSFIQASAKAETLNGFHVINRAYGTVLDITERKETENELTEIKNNLERLVEERTRELEIRNNELLSMNEIQIMTNEKLTDANNELQNFNNLFVNREFRIKELRNKVKELQHQLDLNQDENNSSY